MKYQKRYLNDQICQDLKRKMVFLGGPRQVGKTTIAKNILTNPSGYLSWDISSHRENILKQELPIDTDMWVFDEIHKYTKWRGYIKGIYDEFGHNQKIMITGSARLDFYRHGGDSLQGRYHYLRLHPLSVAELNINNEEDFLKLLNLGGFPEQFLLGSETESKRWTREYRQRLIQEDLLSIENIKDVGNLELLMIRLPELVGSPLSINSLREDLQVSHKAVANWLDIFSNLYAIFRVSPFGSPKIRAVKKEQKHYHYDWTLIEDPSYRFENMVACHILKWIHFEQDTKARNVELFYFRDIDRREVDFIITENSNPIHAIECKFSSGDVSKNLVYFKNKFPDCQAWQIYAKGDKNYVSKDNITHCHALNFLKDLI